MLLFDVASDGAHGCFGSRFPGIRLAPADKIEPARATIGALFIVKTSGPRCWRVHQREMEIFRHNATMVYGTSSNLMTVLFNSDLNRSRHSPLTDDGNVGRLPAGPRRWRNSGLPPVGHQASGKSRQ